MRYILYYIPNSLTSSVFTLTRYKGIYPIGYGSGAGCNTARPLYTLYTQTC